jgi:hypothetical protein
MLNPRISLIVVGLGFGVWETVDIFWIDVPAAAAVVAALFLTCTAWFWRRNTGRGAAALLLLCAMEVAEAPTWQHTATVTKVGAAALGVTGIVAAIATLVGARRARRSDVAAA